MLSCVIPTAPDPALTPNRAYRRGGWQPRRAAASQLRYFTWAAAVNSRPSEPISGPVVVSAVIQWPKGRRRLDYDAAVSVLKPVLDGLTDAGWWRDDRQVTGILVVQETGHERGSILLTVDRPSALMSNGPAPNAVLVGDIKEEESAMPGKKAGGKKMDGDYMAPAKGGKGKGKCPKCGMDKAKCKC